MNNKKEIEKKYDELVKKVMSKENEKANVRGYTGKKAQSSDIFGYIVVIIFAILFGVFLSFCFYTILDVSDSPFRHFVSGLLLLYAIVITIASIKSERSAFAKHLRTAIYILFAIVSVYLPYSMQYEKNSYISSITTGRELLEGIKNRKIRMHDLYKIKADNYEIIQREFLDCACVDPIALHQIDGASQIGKRQLDELLKNNSTSIVLTERKVRESLKALDSIIKTDLRNVSFFNGNIQFDDTLGIVNNDLLTILQDNQPLFNHVIFKDKKYSVFAIGLGSYVVNSVHSYSGFHRSKHGLIPNDIYSYCQYAIALSNHNQAIDPNHNSVTLITDKDKEQNFIAFRINGALYVYNINKTSTATRVKREFTGEKHVFVDEDAFSKFTGKTIESINRLLYDSKYRGNGGSLNSYDGRYWVEQEFNH